MKKVLIQGCHKELSNNSYQALDVGMLLRKAATFSTPVMEITEADGTWSIKTSTTMKTMELKFKVLKYWWGGSVRYLDVR